MNSDELGKDLEHVEVLQAKFNDLQKDLLANEGRLNNVSEMAEEMIKENHPDTDTIQNDVEVCSHGNLLLVIYTILFLDTFWPLGITAGFV